MVLARGRREVPPLTRTPLSLATATAPESRGAPPCSEEQRDPKSRKTDASKRFLNENLIFMIMVNLEQQLIKKDDDENDDQQSPNDKENVRCGAA